VPTSMETTTGSLEMTILSTSTRETAKTSSASAEREGVTAPQLTLSATQPVTDGHTRRDRYHGNIQRFERLAQSTICSRCKRPIDVRRWIEPRSEADELRDVDNIGCLCRCGFGSATFHGNTNQCLM
jgi:hypothetical protein